MVYLERLVEMWPAVLLTLAGLAVVMGCTPREKKSK